MNLVDHLFMLLLFVVQPIHGALSYRRYVAKIDAGEPADRMRFYSQTMILEWVAFAVLAIAWFYFDRPLADLGFVATFGNGFWIGAVLVILVCAYLIYTWRHARTMTDEERAKQRTAFGTLIHVPPQSDRDYRQFIRVSITAGIVEETVYRGFAFWYLAQLMPMWAVIGSSSLIFGLGHSYQGASGILRVTAIGLAFGALYVGTGSIWLPIVCHALLDVLQGASIVEILKDDRCNYADDDQGCCGERTHGTALRPGGETLTKD